MELGTKVVIAGADGIITGTQYTEKEGTKYQVSNPSSSLWYDKQLIKDALGIKDEEPEEELPEEELEPIEEEDSVVAEDTIENIEE